MIPNDIIPTDPRRGAVNTSDDLSKLIAEARQQCAYPNIHFHYSDGPRVMSGLADALEIMIATPAPEPSDHSRSVAFYDWWVGSGRREQYDVLAEQAAFAAWHMSSVATPPVVEEAVKAESLPSVDELSQIIRIADGNHSMGAGDLAEAILAAIRARSATP